MVVAAATPNIAIARAPGAGTNTIANAPPKPADDALTLAMVVPFFEATTDPMQLQPLQTWIARRAGTADTRRRAEGQIRDALKKIRHLREENLQHPYDLAGLLFVERAKLRADLQNRRISLAFAAREYAKLAPVPSMEDLFPTVTGLPIAPGVVSGAADEATAADAMPQPQVDSSDKSPPGADARELMDRLENDITALEQMMDEAERKDDAEEKRLRHALEALPNFVRSAAAPAPAAGSATKTRS